MVFFVTLYITTGLIQDEATDARATLVRGIESDLYGQVDGELSRAQRLVKLSDSDSIGIREAVESATHKAAASYACLLYTSPSPRDATLSRMPSSA